MLPFHANHSRGQYLVNIRAWENSFPILVWLVVYSVWVHSRCNLISHHHQYDQLLFFSQSTLNILIWSFVYWDFCHVFRWDRISSVATFLHKWLQSKHRHVDKLVLIRFPRWMFAEPHSMTMADIDLVLAYVRKVPISHCRSPLSHQLFRVMLVSSIRDAEKSTHRDKRKD